MPLVFAAIAPHPPIIVAGVGSASDQERCAQTISAMKKLAALLEASKPETLVVVSPHAPLDQDSFAINTAPKLTVALDEFSASLSHQEIDTDQDLLGRLTGALEKGPGVPIARIKSPQLDHGTVVPLSFFGPMLHRVKILSLAYSLLPRETHVHCGEILAQVIGSYPKRVAVIASGDLSHRLLPDAPGGFSPLGKPFDEQLVKIVGQANWPALWKLDPELTEAAGECGLRSFIILSGLLKDRKVHPDMLSYEGPFGVGYLVANFKL